MLTVETRYAIDPATAKGLDTAGLRSHFHAGGICLPTGKSGSSTPITTG
jgi:5-keto 4-deoxyuronate isomerase